MSKMNGSHHEDQFDTDLSQLLDQLGSTPSRNQAAVERSRQRFVTELQSLTAAQRSRSRWNQLANWFNRYTNKEGVTMSSPKKRLVLTYVVAIILVAVVLFGGSGMTVLAAQSAIPGDALYSVKTSLEQTRFSMARDAGNRAELQIQYAGLRLQEIEKLIAAGRFQKVAAATQEFEGHIQSALAELNMVSSQDPQRASELLTQITAALSRYANALSGLLASVPAPLQADFLRALETLNASGGLQDSNQNSNLNGNDNLNDNMNVNDNLNDNMNVNDNLNDNMNFNENMNDNENENENKNSNLNQNFNNNQNTNTNTNINTNTNTNANTNTNTNTNRNDNNNDNDNDDDDDDDDDNENDD
jgi:hypothetical protein